MEELHVIRSRIHEVRGQWVMLDSDLAALYGLDMTHFNKAVTRNEKRFPASLRFQLTKRELDGLKFQIGTLNSGRCRTLPFVFTEEGACSIPSVVRSPSAVQVGRAIMEAFIGLRNLQSETSLPKHRKNSRKWRVSDCPQQDLRDSRITGHTRQRFG